MAVIGNPGSRAGGGGGTRGGGGARRLDEAGLFEAGILAAALAIAGAAAVVGGARIAEEIGRARRHREAPPERGAIPGERHRHISTAAAR